MSNSYLVTLPRFLRPFSAGVHPYDTTYIFTPQFILPSPLRTFAKCLFYSFIPTIHHRNHRTTLQLSLTITSHYVTISHEYRQSSPCLDPNGVFKCWDSIPVSVLRSLVATMPSDGKCKVPTLIRQSTFSLKTTYPRVATGS